MRANILATLEKLGVEREKIDEVLAVECRYVHFDYCSAVTHDLSGKLSQENMAAWNEFFSDRKRKGIGFEPGPDELEEFLQCVALLNDEVRERLEDYRHYDRTSTHRRPNNAIVRRG